MNKEIQDLNWKCLPKETRSQMRLDYPGEDDSGWDRGYASALRQFFGHHNLTSNTEPEEMLMVERIKAQIQYAKIYDTLSHNPGHKGAMCALNVLDSLFGDKCLPDKPINGAIGTTPPSCKLDVKPEQPSVQDDTKYKYNIGDLVTYKGKVKKVISRDLGFGGAIMYTCSLLNGLSPLHFNEIDLEPYTEPEYRNLSQEIANCDKSEDNQLKDNMEEKELNPDEDFKMGDDVYLGTELLGKFVCYSYSEHYKEVMVDVLIDSGKDREANQGGWFAKDVSKTPQKPKRWRAEEGKEYWYLSAFVIPEITSDDLLNGDDKLYECGNYFRTKDEAQQAAEAVRETLMKFHEQNQK